MVYTLEMMEHPVKMEVVGGKFLGKSMILSMNKPESTSYTQDHRTSDCFAARGTWSQYWRERKQGDVAYLLGCTTKKFKIEIPRNGHVHYKKYILTSPASTVSLSSGCFFLGFNHPTLQAWPPHAILNYQTIPQVSASHSSSIFKLTNMNHRMVVVVPLRNTMGWQLERIPKAMPMGSSQVG